MYDSGPRRGGYVLTPPVPSKGRHGRLLTSRHGRSRVRAVRDLVHDHLRRGPPEADRPDLRGQAVLARAAHPDQPAVPQRLHHPEAGGRRSPRSGLRRDLQGQPVRRQPTRRAALPLPPPAGGHRARTRRRELRRHHRHGVRQVARLLHPHRGRGAARQEARGRQAYPGHRHLPDERAGQQPAGGAQEVPVATSRAPPPSPSRATPARTTTTGARPSRTTRRTSSSPTS